MIPRTFPSSVASDGKTQMIVYVLPSIAGKIAWIDYIPIKGIRVESDPLANTYDYDGFIVVDKLSSSSGLQEWINYIPVYEDVAYNKPWSTDLGWYIPTSRDALRENLENEDGFNLLLEDGFYLLQEF